MELVIGIGNDWRGDDGIGPRVVDALTPHPGVESITVHQLVPELAEQLQAARRVLFVDAGADSDVMDLARVEATAHHGLGHTCSPGALLGWTKLAFGEAPESWLLRIPAASFEPGAGLSARAERQVPEALRRIDAWLGGHVQPTIGMSEEEV
jgi:hydrogenase maturation protease